MNKLIVIRVIKHAVSNTILIDKLGDFLLPKDQLNNLFKLSLHLMLCAMDVDKQIFILEV